MVDLSPMPLAAQVELITRADVLLGMHGAGLAWVLLLPPHAAMLELWPQYDRYVLYLSYAGDPVARSPTGAFHIV